MTINNVSRPLHTDYYVKIYLLGEFRITRMDGTDITSTSARARCILAILALSENGEITRNRLTQLLWSRHAQEQARTSLRQSLSLLRRTLHHETNIFFTTDRNNVYLNKDHVWIDLHQLKNNSAALLESAFFSAQSLLGLHTDSLLANLRIQDPAFNDWLSIHKKSLKETIYIALQTSDNEKINTSKNILQNNTTVSLAYTAPAENHATRAVCKNRKRELVCPEKTTESEIISPPEHRFNRQKKHSEPELTRSLSLYRNSLLKKVMSFWINGLLEQSLFKKITIELQLKESSEQILHAWKDIVQYKLNSSNTDADPEDNLRTNAEIGEIFSELDESMLILGAPGSGKTTLLLSLTQYLLECAEQDISHPVPVVFHLSTWASHRSPIGSWMEDELENRYQMPRKASAELIQKHAILPLFDGLDEVDAHYREHCIKAINHFREHNIWLSMAICSREEDYKKLSATLTTVGTVTIQAITHRQCDAYLRAIAEPNRGLNTVLEKNAQLRKLLTTPLMLNIASIAYREHTEDILPAETSLADARDHLFCAYTRTMLSRRPATRSKAHYSHESTCNWLTWIARTLSEEKQSIFYLDSIQPHSATAPTHYWLITRGSVIICALLTGITLGLLGSFVTDIKYSLSIAITFSVLGGYVAGLLGYGDRIQPLMHIKLSWAVLSNISVIKHIGNIALAGCTGLGVALIYDPTTGTTLGIFFLLLCVSFNSLDFEPQCKQPFKPTEPNEGMRRSLRYVVIASVVGGTLGFATGFFGAGIQNAIIVSALASLFSALFFGGHTCIQHYLLRIFLWQSKNAPLNYIRFLEYAVDRIFLYRVGGGYIFIHRSLAEHFSQNHERKI